jgi:uncharacterized protein (TIGR02246 family)
MGEDHEQIRRTLGAYGRLCDDGRFDEWAELFTEDARLGFPGQEAEGRDAIKTLMERVQPAEARGKHVTANSLIDVDGSAAAVTTDYLFVRTTPAGPAIVAVGRYHDRLVRRDGRWLFRERRITLLDAPDPGPGLDTPQPAPRTGMGDVGAESDRHRSS